MQSQVQECHKDSEAAQHQAAIRLLKLTARDSISEAIACTRSVRMCSLQQGGNGRKTRR